MDWWVAYTRTYTLMHVRAYVPLVPSSISSNTEMKLVYKILQILELLTKFFFIVLIIWNSQRASLLNIFINNFELVLFLLVLFSLYEISSVLFRFILENLY